MQMYESYAQWKNWRLDFSFSEEDHLYFEKEFARIVGPGQRVIEIGFGGGAFLSWAKQRGAEVYGVEVQEEIVAAANANGFKAVSQIESLFPYRQQGFDAVVALDVFEHISIEEIPPTLATIERLLKPSGSLIVRVPNGGSPFGRWHQYGDVTHVNVMTPAKLDQLALGTKLRVVEIRNQARVLPKGNLAKRMKAWLLFLMREGLNRGLSSIYGFGINKLDQNIVMVLKNTQ